MMFRVTASIARGMRAESNRKTFPVMTMAGLESHTSRSTGGIFRSALSRLPQAVRTLCPDIGTSIPKSYPGVLLIEAGEYDAKSKAHLFVPAVASRLLDSSKAERQPWLPDAS